jgi:hypothetical protein
VEFLSSRQDDGSGYAAPAFEPKASSAPADTGFSQVDDEELPF